MNFVFFAELWRFKFLCERRTFGVILLTFSLNFVNIKIFSIKISIQDYILRHSVKLFCLRKRRKATKRLLLVTWVSLLSKNTRTLFESCFFFRKISHFFRSQLNGFIISILRFFIFFLIFGFFFNISIPFEILYHCCNTDMVPFCLDSTFVSMDNKENFQKKSLWYKSLRHFFLALFL